MEWSVGDVRVTLFRESTVDMPLDMMFPEVDTSVFDEHADWLRLYSLPEQGTLPFSIHAFVLESQGQIILVDSCNGTREAPGMPELSNRPSTVIADMTAAGFEPDAVDVVVCTHLHLDHVGLNTTWLDDHWVPTFPNARYVFTETEYKHWDGGAQGAAVTFSTAVAPLTDFGVVDLVAMDHVINPEVRLEPTPGHSPGHVCVCISSQGQHAVITGDVAHHPVQFVAPDWTMFLDDDPTAARTARHDFIARYADSGVRIFGTHFMGAATGFLEREGTSVRFAAPGR